MTERQGAYERELARTLHEARQALASGDRAAARRWAREAVRRAPRDERGWLFLAAASEPRYALAYVARALDLNPKSVRARKAVRWLVRRMPGSPPAEEEEAAPRPRINAGGPLLIAPLERLSRWSPLSPGVLIPAVALVLGLVVWYGNLPADAGNPRLSSAPVAKASYTPTPTNTPTATPTSTPTATPTSTPTPTPSPTATPRPNVSFQISTDPAELADEGRWIDVDLSEQRITAYEGATAVRSFIVSTGTATHPTVTGQFRVYVKLRATDMSGPGYYLPGVPWTMYFYRGYAVHGTYWHNNFGTPMSHGCVNLRIDEAEWMFKFASVGTLVNVHP